MNTHSPRKRVNVKAVLILVVGSIAFGTAVHFAHGFQLGRNAHILLDEAARAEAAGDFGPASDFYEQYMHFVPEDADARCRYALMVAHTAKNKGQIRRAFVVLSDALRMAPDRHDVRRETAKFALLKVGEISFARACLVELEAANQMDAEMLRLRWQCELFDKKYEAARMAYKAAIEAAPQAAETVDMALQYAAQLRKQGNAAEADAAIGLFERAAAGAPAARLAAARYYLEMSFQLERAEQTLALADNKTASADVLFLGAEISRAAARHTASDAKDPDLSATAAREHVAVARRRLERGAKEFPADARFPRELARLDIDAGDLEAAVARLKTVAQSVPEKPLDVFREAELLIDLFDAGKVDAGKVEERAKALEKVPQAAWAADMLRGRLRMKEEKWGDAREAFGRSLKGAPPDAAAGIHVRVAECFARVGNADQQVASCRAALSIVPDYLPALQLMAPALLVVGQPDEAAEAYKRMAARVPDARVDLAKLLIVRTLRLPEAERKWDAVEKLLKEAPAKRGPEVRLLQAEVMSAKGNAKGAREVVTAERDRDPKQVTPWLLLVSLTDREAGAKEILPLLDAAEKATGPRPEWILVRARYWARTGGKEGAENLKTLETRVEKFSEAEKDMIQMGLGDAFAAAGDAIGAERLWGQLAARRQANLDVRSRLFALHAQAGKDDAARLVLADIARIEGSGGPLASYGEAALQVRLARQNRGKNEAIAAARANLAKAALQRPGWSQVTLLEGELFDLEGQKAKALERYLKVLDRGEASLPIVRRSAELLHEQGKYAEANAVLHKLSDATLAASGLTRASAQLALLTASGSGAVKTRQQALDVARTTVAAGKGKYPDYMWLGQMAVLAGQPAEAEKAFRTARDLDPTAPGAWVSLINVLSKSDAKVAATELEAARTKLPPEKLPLVLAAGYEALGKLKEASEQYVAMAAAAKDDLAAKQNLAAFFLRVGAWKEAEAPLRQILVGQEKATDDTSVWARRGLALILSAQGGYAKFREANELLAANEKSREARNEDRWALALVLAPQPGHRREAIDLLQELAVPATTPVHFRFLLARLYEADGKWPIAEKELRALVAADDKNPAYVAYLARALLRHGGRPADAKPFIDKLAALAPQAFETVDLRARLWKALKKSDEAAKVVTEFAAGKEANLIPSAQLLDDLGATAEAETMYRAAAAKDPRASLFLASHLARHGRLDDALALCEAAWATCPPEAVAAASCAVLRAGQATPAQIQKVETLFAAAAAKTPSSLGMLVFQAQLKEYDNRHGDAAADYRRLLDRDGRNVIALNNLAFILALKDGNTEEALALVNRAIEIAGPHPELLDTRAVVHVKAGNAPLAVEDMGQAIVAEPSGLKYFHMAQAKLLAKDKPAAEEAFQKAGELGLKNTDLHALERSEYSRVAKGIKAR